MRTLIAAIGGAALFALSSGNAAPGAEFITFNRTLLDTQFVDIGASGPTRGDSTISRWRVLSRSGRSIGDGHEVCRLTSPSARLCTGVYTLAGGDLIYEGIPRTGKYLAVTGGTENYRGVSGQLAVNGRTVIISIR